MSSGFLPSMRDKPDSPPVKTTSTPWAVKMNENVNDMNLGFSHLS